MLRTVLEFGRRNKKFQDRELLYVPELEDQWLRQDDRYLHVALLYDIRYKGQLNLSLREQPLLPALDV